MASGETSRAPGRERQFATGLAVAELQRRPQLVIVGPDWRGQPSLRSRSLNGLAFLERDPAFRRLWAQYRPAGSVGQFALYRLANR